MLRTSLSRSLRVVAFSSLAVLAAGCCADGKCIKEPPCRPCEDPCCLTAVQKTALSKSTHALQGGPVAYVWEEKTYVLFTEKGLKDFEKDPDGFGEKGAMRLIRSEGTWRTDINPGDDYDFGPVVVSARPYVKPPAKK